MPRRYCGSWGNPMRMPLSLVLIVLTARASVSPLCARASLSFQRAIPPLAPSRFLPPRDLWGKNSGAEVLSARLRTSSHRLRSTQFPLAFATQRGVSRPFFPTWPASLCKRERSGLVRGKWRWAGRWQHITGSFRCLAHDWPNLLLYAFPPIALLPQVVRHIREQGHKVLLVAPLWRNQPWLSELTQLLTAAPWPVPLRRDLLSQANGTIWALYIWPLNGSLLASQSEC